MTVLTPTDHRRDVAGYTYVYPVVSRRAGGVSVGINLNPNNACNWACIYCQVPNLVRGAAPKIDIAQLEAELREFLGQVLHGDWLDRHVPGGMRQLQDIAFSGNGEPTSAEEFPAVIETVQRVLQDLGLLGKLKVRLITNGSLMHRESVLQAIGRLATMNGEVWFKVDRATATGMAEINQVEGNVEGAKRRLLACVAHCPTWLQTCWFAIDGLAPPETEVMAYLELIRSVALDIQGVHLYGIARQPMQPGAEHLSALSEDTLLAYGERIRALGVTVNVSP